MESTNLKPLRPSDDGRDYVKQAVSLPTKLQRTQALRAINASHINVSLDVLEHLLRGDNIFQRESALDLSRRIIELHRRDLLNARVQSLFEKSSFPLRNIVWLSCQIGIGIPEDTVLRIYTHSDREAVLPYLFHLYNNQKWSTLIENLFVPHPDLHVRLWTQYFSRLDNHSTITSACASPLLELHRLDDIRVNDWIESQLDSGKYDDDILKVIIEAPKSRLYEPLWNAVWKHAKHQSNALLALDATTPTTIPQPRSCLDEPLQQQVTQNALSMRRSWHNVHLRLSSIRPTHFVKAGIPTRGY